MDAHESAKLGDLNFNRCWSVDSPVNLFLINVISVLGKTMGVAQMLIGFGGGNNAGKSVAVAQTVGHPLLQFGKNNILIILVCLDENYSALGEFYTVQLQ